jgi:hypothetical protein
MIKNNSEDNFFNEFDKNVFIKIGEAMMNESYNNNNINNNNNNNNKSLEEYKREYHLKLENDIKNFENEKIDIFNKIELLTISNKKLSDKIKNNELKLSNLNNKFIFFNASEIDIIKKELQHDNKYYNETFEKISNMYEEILKINDYIKKTKSYFV